MKADLLYYKRFAKDLKTIGLVLTTYVPCVENNIVQDKQLTLICHVDDLKMSHVDPVVITKMGDWLKKTYERIFNDGFNLMKYAHGKIHEYLGTTLDFSTDGELMATMIPICNINHVPLPATQ